MTHTPGPWRYTHGSVITERKQLEGRSRYHRFICNVNSLRDDNDDDANGMLIAAAPELLEACKAARLFLSDENVRGDMSDSGYAHYDDVVDALDAALAKAEVMTG